MFRTLVKTDALAVDDRTFSVRYFELRTGRTIFRSTGVFRQLVASPDGRWLLVTWPTANQWVFVRLQPRRIVGVARITQQFGRDARVAGWCCGP